MIIAKPTTRENIEYREHLLRRRLHQMWKEEREMSLIRQIVEGLLQGSRNPLVELVWKQLKEYSENTEKQYLKGQEHQLKESKESKHLAFDIVIMLATCSIWGGVTCAVIKNSLGAFGFILTLGPFSIPLYVHLVGPFIHGLWHRWKASKRKSAVFAKRKSRRIQILQTFPRMELQAQLKRIIPINLPPCAISREGAILYQYRITLKNKIVENLEIITNKPWVVPKQNIILLLLQNPAILSLLMFMTCKFLDYVYDVPEDCNISKPCSHCYFIHFITETMAPRSPDPYEEWM